MIEALPGVWQWLHRIPGNIKPLRCVIDIGCGLNHSPISTQVRQLECEHLVSVDLAQDYLEVVKEQSYEAKHHQCHQADARDVPGMFALWHFDLVLIIDMLEHLEHDEGMNLLQKLQSLARCIIVYLPIGPCAIDKDLYGGEHHDLHTHRSTWWPKELEALGFDVQVYPEASYVENQVVDTAWAIWRENI